MMVHLKSLAAILLRRSLHLRGHLHLLNLELQQLVLAQERVVVLIAQLLLDLLLAQIVLLVLGKLYRSSLAEGDLLLRGVNILG